MYCEQVIHTPERWNNIYSTVKKDKTPSAVLYTGTPGVPLVIFITSTFNAVFPVQMFSEAGLNYASTH